MVRKLVISLDKAKFKPWLERAMDPPMHKPAPAPRPKPER